jgi:hypothetical protein
MHLRRGAARRAQRKLMTQASSAPDLDQRLAVSVCGAERLKARIDFLGRRLALLRSNERIAKRAK